jgi:16S rRNA (adenine1518-N6/adenine1519-N6)-dimethyltransferase
LNYELSPKKSLGQHFLKDENISGKIVSLLSDANAFYNILEIGPGTGALTKFLLQRKNQNVYLIEKDKSAFNYLLKKFPLSTDLSSIPINPQPETGNFIIHADFLEIDLNEIFPYQFAVIGNFPYNISTQILFRILEFRNRIPEVIGMFQKEVAERIASPPNKKSYGILSVLLQAYYNIKYLFTVSEDVFYPPPKVKSAVIKLSRNSKTFLDCNEDLFFEVVKTAFNQRRKMLRNALKPFGKTVENIDEHLLKKRAENLCVDDFVSITNNLGILES